MSGKFVKKPAEEKPEAAKPADDKPVQGAGEKGKKGGKKGGKKK